jgi:hypothetical protein
MNEADIDLLDQYGWVVECESPFELRHEDGSRATGQAAQIVLEYVKREEFPEGLYEDE